MNAVLDFFWGLRDLLLLNRHMSDPEDILVFVFCCSIIGAVVASIQQMYHWATSAALVPGSNSKWSQPLRWIVFAAFGAGLVGFMGTAFEVFQMSRHACLFLGGAWPLFVSLFIHGFDVQQGS